MRGGDENNEWCQVQVSHECFAVILIAEVTFRKVQSRFFKLANVDVLQNTTDCLLYVWEGSAVPDCHNNKRKILQCYLRARLSVVYSDQQS